MKHGFKLLTIFSVLGLLVALKYWDENSAPLSRVRTPNRPTHAPEFPKGLQWFNSKPLRLSDLKGKKAALVQFWRFGCPHCAQAAPRVVKLYHQFKAQGLVVVGVHTPSSAVSPSQGVAEELDSRQVEKKIREWKIDFPVALDNDADLWTKYGAQVYPTFFLIDKKGKIKQTLEGETRQTFLEDSVRKLCRDLKSPSSQSAQRADKTTPTQ